MSLCMYLYINLCSFRYTNDVADLDNLFMHLTNVAIQKHNSGYNSHHGGKWGIKNLRLHIESTLGLEVFDILIYIYISSLYIIYIIYMYL